MSEFIDVSMGVSVENNHEFWNTMINNDLYLKDKIEKLPKGILSWGQLTNDVDIRSTTTAEARRNIFSSNILTSKNRKLNVRFMGPSIVGDIAVSTVVGKAVFQFVFDNDMGGSQRYIEYISAGVNAVCGPLKARYTVVIAGTTWPYEDEYETKNLAFTIYGGYWDPNSNMTIVANTAQRFTFILTDEGECLNYA